jgi:hypothetical protein
VDVGGGVVSVEVIPDALAPVTARNVSGDWSKWAVEFELAAGHHTLRASATDLLGNVGTWQDIVSVKQPIEPGAEQSCNRELPRDPRDRVALPPARRRNQRPDRQ